MYFQTKILYVSFIATVILSIFIIPILRRLKVGQIERDDGPKSHFRKQGTPTMGGIIIALGIIIGTIRWMFILFCKRTSSCNKNSSFTYYNNWFWNYWIYR